jgi:hypothetical protein
MVQIVFMLFVACGGPLSILEAIVTRISVWLFTITILLLWRRWCVRIITLVIILFSVATEEIKVSSPKKDGDMVIIYSKAYGGSGGGRDETDLAWKGRHIGRWWAAKSQKYSPSKTREEMSSDRKPGGNKATDSVL